MHLPLPTPRALLLLVAATTTTALRVAPTLASGWTCTSPSRSLCVRMQADDGEAGGGDIDAFRAQLMRQFSGASVEREISSVREATSLAPGQILVANPARFCSRNPFSRAVQDLERFGLSGPVSDDNMPPDMRASMLPVLALIEHGGSMPSSSAGGKSRALLLERRSGALMGDISMDEYGCVAISPLWLGGLAQQQQLCVVHDVPDLEGATAVCDGMWLGGWRAAQPKVSDRTLAEGRFKFFLGCTEWKAGQLQQEVDAGAWIVIDEAPALILKDRILDTQIPGNPAPVWKELAELLGQSSELLAGTSSAELLRMIYPPEAEDGGGNAFDDSPGATG